MLCYKVDGVDYIQLFLCSLSPLIEMRTERCFTLRPLISHLDIDADLPSPGQARDFLILERVNRKDHSNESN